MRSDGAPMRSRLWYLPLALVFMLGAADSKGKGCSCKPPPEDVVEEVEAEVVTPEVTLQVTSIDPARGEAGRRFDARIYGAGFEPGAVVHFGGMQGLDVQVSGENTIRLQVPALAAGSYDVVVTNPGGQRATLRRGLIIEQSLPDCTFLRVYFEFDQSRLVPDAEQAIEDFLPCYQSATGTILVEGHADERGTIEYNLALGQRRADAVARHLTSRGIAPSRLSTISYGEERPADPGHNEVAWSKNRRADIHVGR